MYSAQRLSRLRSSEVTEVDLLDPDPSSAPVYWVESVSLFVQFFGEPHGEKKLDIDISLFNFVYNLPHMGLFI
jgi:hypothetical protein